ncbi:isotrichodermin C-15 hydroxylase [Microthyrium microscopicum]|uniref:Isotrichodermin C-15 hydroxylase n=1 Tax=Microthyrium microscopicum TaxID=703497 RepID=A0A6A6U192_9PEZI|nr:isotrichodermin C-15 hydroxylase [Microthyrium microscopicum]
MTNITPESSSLLMGFIIAVLSPLFYLLYLCFYNVFLHPLRKIPGSIWTSMTPIPLFWHKIRGSSVYWVHAQHERYGPKVRVAPNEISYINAEAWKEIYGYRKVMFQKYSPFYGKDFFAKGSETGGLLRADDLSHARQRRLCSAAFSDKSLREQEPLLRQYVDLLVRKLSGLAKSSDKGTTIVNLVRWLNFTTFDIMADLTFAESLGLLENSDYTTWVTSLFALFRMLTINEVLMQIPFLKEIVPTLMPKSIQEKRKAHMQHAVDRVDRRMKMKTERPDIWTYVLRFQNSEQDVDRGLSLDEMYSNSSSFMIAGTETSASLLSGLTYLLLRNPEKMDRLEAEILSAFPTKKDICLEKLDGLEYLDACIWEALRCYPPLNNGMPRNPPRGGAMIGDDYVPENTTVYVTHYSAYHSKSNFKQPDEFIPERWLKTATGFEEDNKAVFQPFSFGPRNCIGKKLAFHEMRLIFSNLIFAFDMKLGPDMKDWIKHKSFNTWEKPNLIIEITPRKEYPGGDIDLLSD